MVNPQDLAKSLSNEDQIQSLQDELLQEL